jgi:hypothetical protein
VFKTITSSIDGSRIFSFSKQLGDFIDLEKKREKKNTLMSIFPLHGASLFIHMNGFIEIRVVHTNKKDHQFSLLEKQTFFS